MPMHDYRCNKCKNVEGELVKYVENPAPGEKKGCPDELPCSVEGCDGTAVRIYDSSATVLETIIPIYPGCKRKKAGYQHTHADRPRTKVQGIGCSLSSN